MLDGGGDAEAADGDAGGGLAGEDGVTNEPSVAPRGAGAAGVEKGGLGEATDHAPWAAGIEGEGDGGAGQAKTDALLEAGEGALGRGEEHVCILFTPLVVGILGTLRLAQLPPRGDIGVGGEGDGAVTGGGPVGVIGIGDGDEDGVAFAEGFMGVDDDLVVAALLRGGGKLGFIDTKIEGEGAPSGL